MRQVPAVYVEGMALNYGWRDTTRNLSELIFDTVRAAVDDAGCEMATIDSVVLAAHDLVDGRSLSSMVTAPAAGAYLRDEIRFGDDSAAALAAAVTRLEAGHNTRSIVAAWGRASEHDPLAFSHALFEPSFQRPLGLHELHLSAMRAQTRLRADGGRADRDAAAARRGTAARANTRAVRDGGFRSAPPYPLTPDDLPLWADVTAALVISTEPTPLRIAGVGQSSEPYAFGDRDPAALTGLADAVGRAVTEAGVRPDDLAVVEIDGLTLFEEALGVEAAGLAGPGGGLRVLATDERINASGGGACGYCPPAMGLARIVEAASRTRGGTALATGSSVVAGQTHTAIVLEAA